MQAMCKGCHKPIIAGDLRRGDDWHADCFSDLERSVLGDPKVRKANNINGSIPAGLTDTQYRVLKAAAINGTVVFARGDRRGTRVVKFDELDRPVMVAYSSPEGFLVKRGFLEPGNERHSYRITEAGRSKISR